MFPGVDEGDLEMKVYVKNNKLIVDFGKDLSWFGLNKEDVENFIKLFQEKLKEMK